MAYSEKLRNGYRKDLDDLRAQGANPFAGLILSGVNAAAHHQRQLADVALAAQATRVDRELAIAALLTVRPPVVGDPGTTGGDVPGAGAGAEYEEARLEPAASSDGADDPDRGDVVECHDQLSPPILFTSPQ